jgi:hypothetical protein
VATFSQVVEYFHDMAYRTYGKEHPYRLPDAMKAGPLGRALVLGQGRDTARKGYARLGSGPFAPKGWGVHSGDKTYFLTRHGRIFEVDTTKYPYSAKRRISNHELLSPHLGTLDGSSDWGRPRGWDPTR